MNKTIYYYQKLGQNNVELVNELLLGLQLVTDLVEDQLGGKVELNKDKGTEFRIRFKELKDKEKI